MIEVYGLKFPTEKARIYNVIKDTPVVKRFNEKISEALLLNASLLSLIFEHSLIA